MDGNTIEVSPSKEVINILLVHGNTDYPSKNWYAWLKRELGETFKDVTLNIVIPQFPTAVSSERPASPTSETPEEKLSFEFQTREEWTALARKIMKDWEPGKTILIGHSLGGLFVFDLAEDQGRAVEAGDADPFAAVIAVAPVGVKGDVPVLKGKAQTNLPTFRAITPAFVRKGTKDLTVLTGENDSIVNPKDSIDLAKQCKADECRVVKGYGHFWQGEGVTELPLVYDCVVEKINRTLTQSSEPVLSKKMTSTPDQLTP